FTVGTSSHFGSARHAYPEGNWSNAASVARCGGVRECAGRRWTMPIKLYGHPWSTNTRKVLMVFAEKGHEPQLEVVVLPKGEHKRPEFLGLHPFAKVPVIDDDGFVLYEARAINRYLETRLSGPSLAPSGTKEAARVEMWLGVAEAYFIPSARQVIVE